MTDKTTEQNGQQEQSSGNRRPNPISLRTFHQTLHWITRASLRALAPLVNQAPDQYPKEFILDNQLTSDPNHPNIWTNPRQEDIGPLSVNSETNRGSLPKKNAFFRALRQWRPTHEIGALNLQTRFKLQYILDSDNQNQYKHTLLLLSNEADAHEPQQPQKRGPPQGNPQSGSRPPRAGGPPGRGRGGGGGSGGGRERGGGRGPARTGGPQRGAAPPRSQESQGNQAQKSSQRESPKATEQEPDKNSWAYKIKQKLESN